MVGQGGVSKMVQSLKQIVDCSESEIYTTLVECNMEPNETVTRLLSQGTFQEVKNKREKKKECKSAAKSWNRGARNNTGNKCNSNETRVAQSVPANRRGHWAGPSSAPGILGPRPNSDPMKAAPTSAVTSSSLPAPAYQSSWVNANPGKKTLADIVKMGRPLPQKNVIVPLKDEGFEKQQVSAESKTHADQVSEPETKPNPVASQMDDENPETKPNPVASHPDVDQVAQCSHLVFGTFGLKIGSGQASSGLNDNLEEPQETDEDSSFRHPDANSYGEGEDQLRNTATDIQPSSYQIDSTATNYHASSYYEPEAPQYEPPQEHPQMHYLDHFTNVMNLRDVSVSPPGAGQQAASLYQHPALDPYNHHHHHGMPLEHQGGNYMSYPMVPDGYNPYIHLGFQQGNHQALLVVVGRNGFYVFPVHQQPPGFVQDQQLYQQHSQADESNPSRH